MLSLVIDSPFWHECLQTLLSSSFYVYLLFPLSLAEYLVELREYGPVYSTWGGLEVELSEPLEGVSACIGNCCTALEELSEDMTEDFLPVLREYILYSESMKVKGACWQKTLLLYLHGVMCQ